MSFQPVFEAQQSRAVLPLSCALAIGGDVASRHVGRQTYLNDSDCVEVPVAASLLAMLPFVSLSAAADGLGVTGPQVHDNLAIYIVRGDSSGGVVPLTLEDAITKGQVKVGETGAVNDLKIENIANHEVFVQAGDIVKGGRQDRVLSVDLLLLPQLGQVSIAAFCVEPGRWTARGVEDATKFSSSAYAMPSHDAMRVMQSYAAAAAAAPAARAPDPIQSQESIWSAVRATQDRLSRSVDPSVRKSASPSSLQLSLESEKLKQAQAAYVGALQSAGEASDDIIGYVYAINGKIKSGDLYMSNALFRRMWPKLFAANVTEAIGEKNVSAGLPPSLRDVEAFLASAQTTPKSERKMNASVQLVTGESDVAFYTETRHTDGSSVHRKYVAK